MFTHMMLGSADVERSRKFYDAAMGGLGYPPTKVPEGSPRIFYGGFGNGALGIGIPANGEAASAANGGTVGFAAKDMAQVDAWYAGGMANGGTCGGPPGVRPNAPGKSYGAYMHDPDGNKLCAFCQVKD
jgi:catechol 2,3-dioxygenase-like lactoylglutathione lyase family enzyme